MALGLFRQVEGEQRVIAPEQGQQAYQYHTGHKHGKNDSYSNIALYTPDHLNARDCTDRRPAARGLNRLESNKT